METNTETNNFYAHPELLLVADTVAREKGIDREEILDAIEEAIQKAGRSKYGYEHDIRAKIDRKSGEIHLARFLEVAEIVENEVTQIPVDAARNKKEDAQFNLDKTLELGQNKIDEIIWSSGKDSRYSYIKGIQNAVNVISSPLTLQNIF